MTFGEKLAAIRKVAGITQAELAKEVFVSQSTVEHWETNRRLVPDELIPLINKVLGSNLTVQRLDNKFKELLDLEWDKQGKMEPEFEKGFMACYTASLKIIKNLNYSYSYQKLYKGRRGLKKSITASEPKEIEENQN